MSEDKNYSKIYAAAQLLFSPSQVVELRAIFKNGRVDSGYFDDFDLLADTAASLDRRPEVTGVYWTLNPVNPDCIHRAKNRMREWASKSNGGATTSDREILKRGFILTSRICKVYGTTARKGDNTPERPHRRSVLLPIRSSITLTAEQIEAVASLMPENPRSKPGRPRKNASAVIDVPSWVEEHLGHITITEKKAKDGVDLYVLSECPFDPQHKAPDSVIGQMSSGAVFFKCFHNSCQGHDWKKLRERFDSKGASLWEENDTNQKEPREFIEALRESTGLPVVEVGGGQLRDVVAAVIDTFKSAMGENGPLLYVRGGSLARIAADSNGRLKPGIVASAAMPEIMSRAANFVRIGKNGCVDVFPPESIAKAIVNRDGWPFPELKGIVEIPVLRKDGSVLKTPGYDGTSALYYHPVGSMPVIPENATKEDAITAARFILDILSDFPFQDDASRDNAVGMLLSAIIKEIAGLVPIALIDAPTKGTGKTRLAQLASIVATGRETPLSPEVRDDEEWRKQITSMLIADRQVVIIDNIERTLRSGQLAAVLTTSEWSDRILGKSEALHLHSRTIWIATGNNIRLGGDIARRAYWIRLDSNLPRPWLRDPKNFKRELPAWAVSHRTEIVGALLTMASAWFRDGKPSWAGRPLGSYETWSRTVGGILEYCGMTAFLTNLENLYEQADDEPAQWPAFFQAVLDVFGHDAPFSTKILAERIISDNTLKSALPEKLGDAGDKGFATRLGLALRKRRDQVYETDGGFSRLEEAKSDIRRQKPQWELVFSQSAPPAPHAPRYSADAGEEKNIPENLPEISNELFYSFRERTAKGGARGAGGAGGAENRIASDDYESDEREAIQSEWEEKPCQDLAVCRFFGTSNRPQAHPCIILSHMTEVISSFF
ncbi:MAG: hypothetical protein LBS53_02320, partial [Synergistaceae bacterium]|nr:hypothetical protein [Synergistaceae bacterium]